MNGRTQAGLLSEIMTKVNEVDTLLKLPERIVKSCLANTKGLEGASVVAADGIKFSVMKASSITGSRDARQVCSYTWNRQTSSIKETARIADTKEVIYAMQKNLMAVHVRGAVSVSG
ncbi:hypothetical protein AMATHDRAFT_4367 [Amanita thiersii Skay4041]|uniref:Uncharacterized protein n=1 Tax=Amanita thiersii Skay4041 TaxID=703135 RepID=A0A2A9NHF6_9AGAR|nr:hypothetical protein AMATHDRAFT_4367 [Amanita thiersii Skay4041]